MRDKIFNKVLFPDPFCPIKPISTKYRDIKLFIPLAIQFYYFANPILYPVSASPPWLRLWYEFNPMSMVICAFRDAINGRWPNLEQFIFGFIAALLVFIIGFNSFRKNEQTLVDAL